MKKVYILTSEPMNYQGSTNIDGVFSTYEKALNRINEIVNENEYKLNRLDENSFEVVGEYVENLYQVIEENIL